MTASAFTPTVLTIPSDTTGSGQGELNLVTNPVAASDLSGWVGAGRGTSGGPLNPTITTYFTVLNTAGSESSTSGAYDVISLPSGLQNKKLKVEFYYTSPALDTFKVSVYKGTTRVPLTTDVSGTTSLPQNTTGKFVAYFDTDSSGTWTVSITRTGGIGSTALQFTNVVVGPGIQPQGAVVGEWQSYTPTSSWTTNTTHTGKYRRVGDSIEIMVDLAFTGIPAGATYLSLNQAQLLNGLNLSFDNSKFPNSTDVRISVGTWAGLDSSVNGGYGGTAGYGGTGAAIDFGFVSGAGVFSNVSTTAPVAWNTGDNISFRVTVPVAEWAGSGTVQLAQNDVEFSSNSNATNTATDTTSFVYGPSGALVPNGATGTTYSRTVQFQTPIQVGDKLELEYSSDRVKWIPMPFPRMSQGVTNDYGAAVFASGVNTAAVAFYAGGYAANNATYGGLGQAWSTISANYWRVRKSSAGAAVGFGIVSPGVSSGLVAAAGLPGNTTGNAIASGYVGEVVTGSVTFTPSATSGTWASSSLSLATGTWLVSVRGYKPVEGTMTMVTAGTGSSISSTPVEVVGPGSATIPGTGMFSSSGTAVINNSTGSIKLYFAQYGTSLGSSGGGFFYSCTRIA
jgi:hypothetical protein